MYSTRDTPQCWQEHVKGVMKELGFAAGKANPCVYRHRTRNLVIPVHVDDFICAGPRADLDWVRKELPAHCQCTSSILGPDEQKQVKYLSRILERTGDTHEHDPRHVEAVLKEMGMENCKPVSNPGVKLASEVIGDGKVLDKRRGSEIRRVIAILNYIAQDRPDLPVNAPGWDGWHPHDA